jgi:hypothetical protein
MGALLEAHIVALGEELQLDRCVFFSFFKKTNQSPSGRFAC